MHKLHRGYNNCCCRKLYCRLWGRLRVPLPVRHYGSRGSAYCSRAKKPPQLRGVENLSGLFFVNLQTCYFEQRVRTGSLIEKKGSIRLTADLLCGKCRFCGILPAQCGRNGTNTGCQPPYKKTVCADTSDRGTRFLRLCDMEQAYRENGKPLNGNSAECKAAFKNGRWASTYSDGVFTAQQETGTFILKRTAVRPLVPAVEK